jgi:hypothetical protein
VVEHLPVIYEALGLAGKERKENRSGEEMRWEFSRKELPNQTPLYYLGS